jgi:hypothetical protein
MRSSKEHLIEFVTDWWAELEKAPSRPLEQVVIRRGSRRRAHIRPRILAAGNGLVEVADLIFDDGAVARGVPFAAFTFVE